MAAIVSALSILSLAFMIACSSNDRPGSLDSNDDAIRELVYKTCNVMSNIGYHHDTLAQMVEIYARQPTVIAMYPKNAGPDRPVFRNRNIISMADSINQLHPNPIAMAKFCHQNTGD